MSGTVDESLQVWFWTSLVSRRPRVHFYDLRWRMIAQQVKHNAPMAIMSIIADTEESERLRALAIDLARCCGYEIPVEWRYS